MKSLFLLLFLTITTICAAEFVVIVNNSNSESSIQSAMLRRIYTGRANSFGGQRVVPINLNLDSPTAQAFLRAILDQSSDEYREFWVNQQVRGAGTAPMVQNSSQAVINLVSTIPGAIAYIPKDDLTDNVKVIELR